MEEIKTTRQSSLAMEQTYHLYSWQRQLFRSSEQGGGGRYGGGGKQGRAGSGGGSGDINYNASFRSNTPELYS